MKFKIIKISVFVGLMSLYLNSLASTQEEKIKDIFYSYRVNLTFGDGRSIYGLIDKTTKDYYSGLLQYALYANRAEIERLELLERYSVLLARHSISKEELSKMTGKGFIVHSVEKGWFSQEAVLDGEIRVHSIQGTIAKTRYINAGTEMPFGFEFVVENDTWKINLVSMLRNTYPTVKQAIKSLGYTEEKFISDGLKRNNGKDPVEGIWEPIIKGAKYSLPDLAL